MTDLDPIACAVARVEPGCAIDDIADALGRVKYAKEELAEIEAELKARLLARVLAGGPFRVGETLYVAKYPENIRCPSVREGIENVLQHNGGNFDVLNSCLSVNALKPGACRKVLPPEVWARVFVVERVAKLGTEPVKELVALDVRYLPGVKARAAAAEEVR